MSRSRRDSGRLDAIDTPRTYRGELPPSALEWSAVQALLRSIDRGSKSGERDYAILHLMAHYGLRPSEIALLRLDSIDWTSTTLRVEQRKTQSDLVLPLAPATVKALRRYLRRDRDRRQEAREHPTITDLRWPELHAAASKPTPWRAGNGWHTGSCHGPYQARPLKLATLKHIVL